MAADIDEGLADTKDDLRAILDDVVERLLGVCGTVGAAAAGGRPGAFVLADELLRRASPRRPERRPTLARGGRLAELGLAFELDGLSLDLLLVAAAADLDERVEVLCGYAHDDLTRRRPSVGLAASLCGVGLDDPALHVALGPDAPLAAGGLLIVDDPFAAVASRPLRCPDRVSRWLVGVDEPLPPLSHALVDPPALTVEGAERIARAISAGVAFHYVEAPPATDPNGLAVGAAAALGSATLVVDLDRVPPGEDLSSVVVDALREARMRRSILVAGPVERLVDAGVSPDRWARSGWPTILHGSRSWDPTWTQRPPLLSTATALAGAAQLSLWQRLLAEDAPPEEELAAVATSFRLTGEQITLAAAAAVGDAAAAGRKVTAEDLRRSARSRNTGALDRLARRVRPEAGWDDLVLPTTTMDKLRELVERSRHRELVYDAWGLGGPGHRSDGLTALFAGPSGTGKTLAAEVVAGALGLDMYIVDLSGVVDKYIGETEKNLERIFDEAERVNGVLVFDEADALFGKRSEVSDAHDRYANLETAYLLQRFESFNGTAILTTNLRSNIDDAFARRLGAIVAFPAPDQAARLALWQRFLIGKVPLDEDVDLAFCSAQFELTGANIRNVAVAAAFFAAEDSPPVQMEDVIRGVEREYEKLGRLRNAAEFGRYAGLLSEAARG